MIDATEEIAQVTGAVRELKLAHREWEVRGRGPGAQTLPQKGTWSLTPPHLLKQFPHKAMLSCPNCGEVAIVPESQVDWREEYKVAVYFLPGYQCAGCKTHGNVILEQWEVRKLYCIAWESQHGSSIVGHKDYLHAVSDLDARRLFLAGRTKGDNLYQIVGVGPVIGYHVQDNKGEVLSV